MRESNTSMNMTVVIKRKGEDGVFKPANVKFNESNKSYILSNPDISVPKEVRYCFKNFQIGNVVNHRNLPLVPFRSNRIK